MKIFTHPKNVYLSFRFLQYLFSTNISYKFQPWKFCNINFLFAKYSYSKYVWKNIKNVYKILKYFFFFYFTFKQIAMKKSLYNICFKVELNVDGVLFSLFVFSQISSMESRYRFDYIWSMKYRIFRVRERESKVYLTKCK